MFTTIIAGAFVLGVVVLVHEFGHFIVAKKAGIFVKTFSIGFGKKILRRRFGETEYTLSILPFGGYVKFAGESEFEDDTVEEVEDEENVKRKPSDEIPDSEIPPERYYTNKPKWVRAAVLFAGPFMNYVLAVLIYVGVFYVQGSQVIPTTIIGEVTPGGPADSLGLMVGDEIRSIDGVAVSDWQEVERPFLEDSETAKEFVLDRGGVETTVMFTARIVDDRLTIGFRPLITSRIGRVQRAKPAYLAGIRGGAVIESINDTLITTYDDIRRIVNANPGVPIYVRWSQDGISKSDSIVPEAKEVLKAGSTSEFETVGLIGIGPDYVRKRESLIASVGGGFRMANGIITQIISYLGQLVRGKMGVKTLGGPILITQMAGDIANWGFDYLLLFLAFFNINLCIFNLLPILPFDGGHLAILGIEGISRRPLNTRVRGWLTQGGFILVILLMLFVVMLDLSRCSGVL